MLTRQWSFALTVLRSGVSSFDDTIDSIPESLSAFRNSMSDINSNSAVKKNKKLEIIVMNETNNCTAIAAITRRLTYF